MSEAPALPAQTPGMFVGGGGSGTSLTGRCAEAAADCGLTPLDFAPFEQLIQVVRVAHNRCQDYDDALWLVERKRAFETQDTQRCDETRPEAALPRRPTSRASVTSPRASLHRWSTVVSIVLWPTTRIRTIPPGAGWPGATGYDSLECAPAAPLPVGLRCTLAVHRAFSTLHPNLLGPDGQRLPPGTGLGVDTLGHVRGRMVLAVR